MRDLLIVLISYKNLRNCGEREAQVWLFATGNKFAPGYKLRMVITG